MKDEIGSANAMNKTSPIKAPVVLLRKSVYLQ